MMIKPLDPVHFKFLGQVDVGVTSNTNDLDCVWFDNLDKRGFNKYLIQTTGVVFEDKEAVVNLITEEFVWRMDLENIVGINQMYLDVNDDGYEVGYQASTGNIKKGVFKLYGVKE